jgi:hypothetical protein
VGKLVNLALIAGAVYGAIYVGEQFDLFNRVAVLLHGYPHTPAQANRDLMLLSRDYYIGVLNHDTYLQTKAHQEADKIRSDFGTQVQEPAGGYNAATLQQLGLLTAQQVAQLNSMGVS